MKAQDKFQIMIDDQIAGINYATMYDAIDL